MCKRVMFMCLYLTKPSFCKNHPTYCNTEGLRFFQERLLLKWTLTGLASCSCPGLNGHRNTDNRVISNYNRCPWFEVFLKFQQRLQYGHGKKKVGRDEGRKLGVWSEWCALDISSWSVCLQCQRALLGKPNRTKMDRFCLLLSPVTEWLILFCWVVTGHQPY